LNGIWPKKVSFPIGTGKVMRHARLPNGGQFSTAPSARRNAEMNEQDASTELPILITKTIQITATLASMNDWRFGPCETGRPGIGEDAA
jgi:hypothetical protein